MSRTVCWVAAATMVFLVGASLADEGAKRPYRLSSGLSVDYTDNRDSTETDKIDSTDLSLWVAVDLLLERESKYQLSLGYQPSIRYRTNPSESQDASDLYHDLKMDGWYKPSRLVRLHMSEALNYTDDPAVDKGGATIRRDASFFLNRASVGVETELSRLLRGDVSAQSMVKRYRDDAYSRTGDEDGGNGTVALGWILDRMSILSMYGSYGVFGYPGSGADEGDRGFSYVEAGVSFRREISKTLQGRVDVAYKRLDYDASALGTDQSPCGYATLLVSPSPRLRFSGSAGYVLRDADLEYFASQRNSDVTLRGEWDVLLPKRLTVGLSGSYRSGAYKADSLSESDREILIAAGLNTEGRESTVALDADLTYRLKKWLVVSIVAKHEEVSSDVSQPFERNSAGLRTTFDF